METHLHSQELHLLLAAAGVEDLAVRAFHLKMVFLAVQVAEVRVLLPLGLQEVELQDKEMLVA